MSVGLISNFEVLWKVNVVCFCSLEFEVFIKLVHLIFVHGLWVFEGKVYLVF